MVVVGDIFANEPIYYGLASGLVVYIIGSLLSKPTASDVMAEWDRRSRGESTASEPVTDAKI
jgi:SSS family solute:Na+ symporter